LPLLVTMTSSEQPTIGAVPVIRTAVATTTSFVGNVRTTPRFFRRCTKTIVPQVQAVVTMKSNDERRYQRAPFLKAYDRDAALILVGSDGVTRRLEDDSAALVRELLDYTLEPRTRAQITAHISELSGEDAGGSGVLGDALSLLQTSGALIEAGSGAPHTLMHRTLMHRTRLVLALCGGIAASFAPSLIEQLLRRGYAVRIAATESALRFISTTALEALTHEPVLSQVHGGTPAAPVPHLELARWAELVVIWPATATTLSRIANGDCSSLVAALAISTRAPVLVVPAMNDSMYRAPSVQRQLEQLRDDGFLVMHPSIGYEVADRPDARQPMLGAAPPINALVDTIESVRRAGVPGLDDWDRIHRAVAHDAQPWFAPDLDPDVIALLERMHITGGHWLDIGCGSGSSAIAAAARGFSVVASDVSPHALELARSRSDLPICWLLDDITQSRLEGAAFDVVHDRGCLHVLPVARHAAWGAAVTRLTAPGGLLIVKAHSELEPEQHGTHKLSVARIAALLSEMALVHEQDTVMPGQSASPRAILAAFRRPALKS
jgi:2-polyprenyl-3-methyl-5-hydroxy-6-metoxy-1,4-benzoquinol methylase